MATPNPMDKTFPNPPRSVSKVTHCIAGILVTVYGLDELAPHIHNVVCLWLLHPRLQTKACMEPIAYSTINQWNQKLESQYDTQGVMGLIAVSFDQRNHGSREVDALANEAWKVGNKRHAQDMFTTYHGTAVDTSHLLTYISSYIFPTTNHTIVDSMVLGVSLGGHAAWHCLMHDPRVSSAIVIIGCPDYVRLMTDRARLSKLKTWTESTPPGLNFLRSADFPAGLVDAVEKYDPAGLLLGEVLSRNEDSYTRNPTEQEQIRLMPLMKSSLQGKRILNMAGGSDKLVPYKCSEPFLQWLKNASSPEGFFSEEKLILEDIVFDGTAHEMTPAMVNEVYRFVLKPLEQSLREPTGRNSKM